MGKPQFIRPESIGRGRYASVPAVGTPIYTTNFSLTENPMSESGFWTTGTTAPDESAMRTSGGLCYGTQVGNESGEVPPRYNDSHAFANGVWSRNHQASGVIHFTGANIATNGNLEIEVLLGMSIGTRTTGNAFGDTAEYGYEINLATNSPYNGGKYVQCGRWKRNNLFDSAVSGSPLLDSGAWGAPLGVNNGDIFSAKIIYTSPTLATISAYLTRAGVTTQLFSVTDDPSWLPNPGAPGNGQYRHDVGGSVDPTDLCFSSWTGRSL